MTALMLIDDGPVAILTLTRPDRRNALDATVCAEITQALRAAEARARAVLIRGEGPAFCAGANLKGGVYAPDFFTELERMLATVTGLRIPVIADIQGPAVGAGCQLALACDLRVMGPTAAVWIPAVQHGFSLGPWTVRRAVELLGGSIARNMLLTGARLTARQALAIGFALSSGNDAEALATAHEVAAQAPLATAYFKAVFNNPTPDEAMAARLAEQARACWESWDVREAREARRQGRAPEFQGR